MALKIKPQPVPVSLLGMQPQMALAAQIVAGVFAKHDLDCDTTSCTEGKHGRGSKHPIGHALDFSLAEANKITPRMADNITADCKAALGREFDVVNEGNHLHVEFDPKQGVNQ